MCVNNYHSARNEKKIFCRKFPLIKDRNFTACLETLYQCGKPTEKQRLALLDFYLKQYGRSRRRRKREANNRLLLLDYAGSLTYHTRELES
jgi:hypothetical protein